MRRSVRELLTPEPVYTITQSDSEPVESPKAKSKRQQLNRRKRPRTSSSPDLKMKAAWRVVDDLRHRGD
jgi:hypothetical protein